MSDTNLKVGVRLHSLRESHGLSLEDVGRVVHRSRKTIHDYEHGKISISLNILKAILDIYGISVGKFLDDLDE